MWIEIWKEVSLRLPVWSRPARALWIEIIIPIAYSQY